VKWEFVGDGARDAPFDHRAPEYLAFWQAHRDNSQRQQPLSIDDVELPSRGLLHRPMLSDGVPNVYLYRNVSAPGLAGMQMGLFIYGVPFRECVLDKRRFATALANIDLPRANEGACWCPVTPDPVNGSRLYCALVLRLQFLTRQLKQSQDVLGDNAQSHSPQAIALMRWVIEAQQMHIDSHWMLVCAIKQLGAVPNDDDGDEWRVLLERYSPDVNMFLHRGELSSLYSRIIRLPFFSAGVDKVMEHDALLRSFRKALPVRCASRDSASKDASESGRNRAYFCFLKTTLAAVMLGIYEHTNERPAWRMRIAIYELFFFSLDPRLMSARMPRADGRLGGSREAMRADYAIVRSLIRLGNDAHIVLSDYSETVRSNYLNARRESARTAGEAMNLERAASGAANAPTIVAAVSTGEDGNATTTAAAVVKRARSGSTSSVRRRREAAVTTNVSATLVSTSASSTDANGGNSMTAKERDTRAGFALYQAMVRLRREQELGLHYWQQCKAAGALPCSATGVPAAPPVPADTEIGEQYALRNTLPCDDQLPETLYGDEILFEFIHARSVSLTRARAAAAAAPLDGGSSKPSAHYVYQSMIIMALRAFMCNALRRYTELHRELCARTQWARWDELVSTMLDFVRRSLSAKCDELGAADRPLTFLSHYQAFNFVVSQRTAHINNLYRVASLPFSEVVELEIEAFLNKGGLDRAADYVMPVEYEVVLTEALRRLDYPRSYRDPAVDANGAPVTSANGTDDATMSSSATTTTTAAASTTTTTAKKTPPLSPYYEYIDRDTRAPFSILPTKACPLDEASLADIQRDYVDRALVPLRAFRATSATIDAYNAAHMSYTNRASNTHVVPQFIERLADVSMFQLQIIRAFVRSINKHCRTYTMPLPRYLEAPVNSLLCREHHISDPALLPPHASRTAVCTHCYRAAVFVETARKRNMATAIGTDRTRMLQTTINERAITNVLARGALLAPNQLGAARSLYGAYNRRAFRCASVLDDVTYDDPMQRKLPPVTRVLNDEEARRHMLDILRAETNKPQPPPTDRRITLPEHRHARGEPSPALHQVGKDSINPMLAMLDFDESVWREYSRRTPHYKLLLGHNVASENRDMRWGVVHYADNPVNFKGEAKKQSRAAELQAQKAQIVDPKKRASREKQQQKSRRGNVLTYLLYRECSQSDMFELDRRHALVTSRVRKTPPACIDFYMCCCVCGVSVMRSDCTWRGALLTCPKCVNVLPASSAALNGVQNDGSSSSFTNSAMSVHASNDPVRALLRQFASASYGMLFDDQVPEGAQCVVPRCWVVKTPLKRVYGKEVVFDTTVGAERFGYVYVCEKHAADRSWIFAPTTPTVMPLSMLMTLCLENRTHITPNDQAIDHLPRYMEQLSSSQRVGRAITDAEQARRRHDKETKRREQIAREIERAAEQAHVK